MKVVDPASAGFSSTRLQRISAKMQTYVDQGKLAGMITTVAHHGQTVHLEKTGWMDREAQRPMELDAIFRIASMTKPITAVAIMTLYEEGYFTLNTPISEFIPGFRDVKVFVRETEDDVEVEDLIRPVTFRHLFTHTAGLSYGWNQDDPVDRCYIKLRKAAGSHPEKTATKRLPRRFAMALPKVRTCSIRGTGTAWARAS